MAASKLVNMKKESTSKDGPLSNSFSIVEEFEATHGKINFLTIIRDLRNEILIKNINPSIIYVSADLYSYLNAKTRIEQNNSEIILKGIFNLNIQIDYHITSTQIIVK